MENTKPIRAGLQVRVSTAEQAVEGYSLIAQEEKLKKYADYMGYTIAGIYRDDGYSGASINRPGYRQMMADVQAHKVDIILIYKLDRLSRSVRDMLATLAEFDKYDVKLFSLTENIDLSSPFGRAALKMSATFSELERETILERTKMGKDYAIRQGKCMFTRVAPFGYRYDLSTQKFIIIPEEAEMVKDIYAHYINGMSIRNLNIYCRNKYNHPRFNNPMSCKEILHRPMYTGYFIYKGELIKGTNFEGFLPYEDFVKVTKILAQNAFRRTRESSPYLLTGLLICAKCGNRYCGKFKATYQLNKNGERKKYGARYYGCAVRFKGDKVNYPGPCTNTTYRADDLDNYIINIVKNIEFADVIGNDVQIGVFDTLQAESAEIKKKIDKLLDLYMSDLIDKLTYEKRLTEYEKQIKKNDAIIKERQQEVDAAPPLMANYLKEKQAQFETLPLDEKRLFLKVIIKYIAIDGENIHIEWRINTK